MKICIVQYTHKILISFLIFFYILPLLFSFFLHGKLIYFIRSKHHQHYFTTEATYKSPKKHHNTYDSQIIVQKNGRILKQTILSRNQQLLQPKTIHTANRRMVTFNNTDTIRNTAGSGTTTMTTTAAAAAAVAAQPNNSSNSSASSRSSNGTSFVSIASPITFYKINSQANANAKRTVLLLVLLLSFYVLCWAPYNIYTWSHAYQLTINNRNSSLFNRTLSTDFNENLTSLTDNLHSDLRRIIFINYSLYLLSMISMCFSFIFYFSLNKQARREFTSIIGCICPSFMNIWSRNQRKNNHRKETQPNPRGLLYHTRYQHHYPMNNNQRIKTTKFKTHSTFVPRNPNQQKTKNNNGLPKRTLLAYDCHVQFYP
jgi:hypothetical protein